MALDFKFIGWCHDPQENHDKVWGAIYLDPDPSDSWLRAGRVLTFWGRRGKKLQTKVVKNDHDLMKLIRTKTGNKGYIEVDVNKLESVYPEFYDDIAKTAMWEMFKL